MVNEHKNDLAGLSARALRARRRRLAARLGDVEAVLAGSLVEQTRRCGKPGCRCVRGELHGPFWSRRWRADGRQRRAYVPRRQVAAVLAGIAARRELHPPAWTMRRQLAELRRLEQEALG